MSFSNIEVNYNSDIMSLHVMIDLQCPNNAGGIAGRVEQPLQVADARTMLTVVRG